MTTLKEVCHFKDMQYGVMTAFDHDAWDLGALHKRGPFQETVYST